MFHCQLDVGATQLPSNIVELLTRAFSNSYLAPTAVRINGYADPEIDLEFLFLIWGCSLLTAAYDVIQLYDPWKHGLIYVLPVWLPFGIG